MIFDSIYYDIQDKHILRGVYLKLTEGKITGIVGLNGCGKSTLMNIGAKMIKQSSGNVFIDSENLNDLSMKKLFKKLAYLSQDSFLPKDLTARKLFKKIKLRKDDSDNDPLMNKIYNQLIKTLSGGELRYLEIYTLFKLDRKYYFLDEPFTGIEPKIIERIIQQLHTAKAAGKGILLTDHYQHYVSEVLDEAYFLEDGQCKLFKNL